MRVLNVLKTQEDGRRMRKWLREKMSHLRTTVQQ